MKKRIIAALTALTVVFAMAGCAGEPTGDTVETPADTEVVETDGETVEETEVKTKSGVTGSSDRMTMSISKSGGTMQISRPEAKSDPMGDEGTWTIFLYLCGTDLETRLGAASGDLAQIFEAAPSENVRWVIQMGGTKEWADPDFSSEEGQRWVIENGQMQLVDTVELDNMGDPDYLEDFLRWGIENYPAEKMGVDIWDHGGGSITGACFDELYDADSLSLREMDDAFASVYEDMTDQFEFIGFDCCLMGTAEVANVMATYARYFYASQECEPGSGWDYSAITDYLTQNPDADGGDLGKVVADSFYAECKSIGQERGCTFTIVDCSYMDDFVIEFNDYAAELYEAAFENLNDIVRGVKAADNFGGNNKAEGYTNMVDLGSIVDQCSDYADGSSLLQAMEDMICYNINGKQHKDASGLSVYYPLQIGGSEELKIYSDITLSPYYLSIVDMVAKGYTEGGYDNAIFFSPDGGWDSMDAEEADDYFDYADEDDGGMSELISFAVEPYVDDDGIYSFILDEDGIEYGVGVEAMIYMDLEDGRIIELGETYDIYGDWETGEFCDNFDGYWLALPDGQPLPTYIVDSDEDYIVYTAPIMLNGELSNLRIISDDDGIYIEGAWSGIDENGIPARDIRKLSAGDEISPIYTIYAVDEDAEDDIYVSDPYTWEEGDDIIYTYLEEADYLYGFAIEDVYGDYFITDFVTFTIDENGDITF